MSHIHLLIDSYFSGISFIFLQPPPEEDPETKKQRIEKSNESYQHVKEVCDVNISSQFKTCVSWMKEKNWTDKIDEYFFTCEGM